MVESFKITAKELRRNLKIHVHLPDDYHENENYYPLFVIFDGQLMFNFIGEETKICNTQAMLEEVKNDAIYLFLHSPGNPLWRLSELNPYYNGEEKDVDIVLSYIYYEYISNQLLPLLKGRYRFLDDIYLMGYKEGAISALYMNYRYPFYKGCALFDLPFSDCKEKIYDDLNSNFTCKKKVYLYHGGIASDAKDDDLFYRICTRFESLKTEVLLYDFDSNLDNSIEALEIKFKDAVRHLK